MERPDGRAAQRGRHLGAVTVVVAADGHHRGKQLRVHARQLPRPRPPHALPGEVNPLGIEAVLRYRPFEEPDDLRKHRGAPLGEEALGGALGGDHCKLETPVVVEPLREALCTHHSGVVSGLPLPVKEHDHGGGRGARLTLREEYIVLQPLAAPAPFASRHASLHKPPPWDARSLPPVEPARLQRALKSSAAHRAQGKYFWRGWVQMMLQPAPRPASTASSRRNWGT
mmetsp:Transcript_47723/g.152994  ORF Transcript_47723/g.152994 Transcript_47723/m.152994 type:complete len:227 (-) Transcript_47723:954-1634(-)